jgi:hypothetical protein
MTQTEVKLPEMSWDQLLAQLRDHPFPWVRQEIMRELTARIWDGPSEDEEYVPSRVFDPSW